MGENTCLREPLPSRAFDVVVVGGGVHGVAIARACALAGKSTLILEQHDFGSGVSSWSPRTVGDVLGDLERGDLGLARETLRERDRLLVERSHLVRPMTGVVALAPDSRRSKLEVRFGLWMRRQLGSTRQWRANEAELQKVRRIVGANGPWTLLPFDDAVCEYPERLIAEWLREALNAGAVARNYYRALAPKIVDETVHGVTVRDLLTGREQLVHARWLINATGPAVDGFLSEAGVSSPKMSALARSVHVVLRRFAGAPEATLYIEDADGQAVVLVPWNDQLLLTSLRMQENASPVCGASDAELERLLQAFGKACPGVRPEVTGTFGGAIAVPQGRGFGARLVRNRSLVFDHEGVGARGLLSVVGGSLTTASPAAHECAHIMGFRVDEMERAEYLPGPANGVEIACQQWARTVASFARISEPTARGIAAWHGGRALCVARMASTDAALRVPLCDHSDHIVAEAVDAVRYEAATTLADILLRRVPVALSSCWSDECTRAAAKRIGAALRWSANQIADQVLMFDEERARLKPRLPVRNLPDTLPA